ncbi:MAG: GNAT family N-acetyltransferase [Tissierellia bacterium]|nr:GNAT family N-acetyltransferase [Tissierellia bacterium]
MESMNKMELVNLEKEHYEDLIRIHDQIFPEIYISGREIVEKIGVNRDVFVLSEETELDAYCVLRYWENSDNITVEILGVDEEKRGKGYGRKLLSNVLDYIFSERFKSANLIVDADNEKAISLYTSLGFKIQKIDLHYTL